MEVEFNTTVLSTLVIYFILVGIIVGLVSYFYREK
jgi:hypothetical protein